MSAHDEQMLALERKATFHERDQSITVKAQPFGGAVRINNTSLVNEITGGFRFDSERSRVEQDFRILIRPSAWVKVRDFCLKQFQTSDDEMFETSPIRELAEEFHDSLGVQLSPDQYICHPLWTVLENNPTPTDNIHAEQQSTVRIYHVFETQIVDSALWHAIQLNSESVSDEDLRRSVVEDRRTGGKGRANACFTLPVETLRQFYLSMSPEERSAKVPFMGVALEDNIPALLDGVAAPRFEFTRP